MEVDTESIEEDVEEGTLFQQENSEPEVKSSKSESSSRYYNILKNPPADIPFYEVDPPEIIESTTCTEWLYLTKKKGKDKEDKKDKKPRVQWKMGGRANYWPKDNPMMLTQYGTATDPAMKRRISILLKKRDNVSEECSVWEKELQSLKKTKSKSSTKELSTKKTNLQTKIWQAKYEPASDVMLVHVIRKESTNEMQVEDTNQSIHEGHLTIKGNLHVEGNLSVGGKLFIGGAELNAAAINKLQKL